jgi:hypothetical protein
LFEAGFRIEQVALVTGHKDWKMLKRYTNLRPEGLHDAAEQLKTRAHPPRATQPKLGSNNRQILELDHGAEPTDTTRTSNKARARDALREWQSRTGEVRKHGRLDGLSRRAP